MSASPERHQMLVSGGFRFHFDREAYVNRKTRKIVSVEAAEDHSEEWLSRVVTEPNDSTNWRFYFDGDTSPDVIRAFLAELR